MKIHDTLSKSLVEFTPRDPPRVTMYVCGPTVYDSPHVGHARSAVAFDVIRRYLEYTGFDVIFTRNYTDVDDKMIARASERGTSITALARQYIDEYEAAMDALNVKPPVYAPRATHLIPDFIAFIQVLLDKDAAYVRDGNVYFRVSAHPAYGRLSRKPDKEIEDTLRRDSEEFAAEKEDPRDFALWKARKPGEPAWPSPWGEGRPGWHVECSVMSTKLLGKTIDIHGGGMDLVFPHHENEIAQSEAYSGETFCKYWLHNGFVNVDEQKMSKSLGNFFSVAEVLSRYEAPVLRLFLIGAQYRNPINYSTAGLDQAAKNWARLRDAWTTLAPLAVPGAGTGRPAVASPAARALLADYEAGMDDDFNTPRALAALFSAVKAGNEALAAGDKEGARDAATVIVAMLAVLGFDARYMTRVAGGTGGDACSTIDALVKHLVDERERERKVKNFKRADEIRAMLAATGIELRDGKDGTTWGVRGPPSQA